VHGEHRVTDRYIYDGRQESEKLAIDRWLDVLGRSKFPAALGLPSTWWCGIRLPRVHVLNRQLAGDIDIVAGPLGRVEGRIEWSPRVDYLVACEVKASWFEPGIGWHRTHSREVAQIKGQLEVLLDSGFDRVAFLHIGGTKPSGGQGHPWGVALNDAYEGTQTFPRIFGSGDLPLCVADLSTVIGALPHKTEERGGAGGALTVYQVGTPSPRAGAQSWREQLQARLEDLPGPPTACVFIKPCPTCAKWGMFFGATDICLDCNSPEAGTS
jgi:hypothetical protein